MRTEALTGSITTYTSGESWSNKGHKKDKKGKNSRWWKSHEKWIYTSLMCFISNLFQRNWRLPLEGNLWEQETWISYTAKDETEYRKCQNWILLLVNLKVYKLVFLKKTYTYVCMYETSQRHCTICQILT